MHKTGAVSLWAQAAQVGDAVTFSGPRDGGFNLLPDAQRLLLIGDPHHELNEVSHLEIARPSSITYLDILV
jgi:hypothetical protein